MSFVFFNDQSKFDPIYLDYDKELKSEYDHFAKHPTIPRSLKIASTLNLTSILSIIAVICIM